MQARPLVSDITADQLPVSSDRQISSTFFGPEVPIPVRVSPKAVFSFAVISSRGPQSVSAAAQVAENASATSTRTRVMPTSFVDALHSRVPRTPKPVYARRSVADATLRRRFCYFYAGGAGSTFQSCPIATMQRLPEA